ncbi:hypothetical protein [Senegalia sp. (in: firmicutes)]|uniref:hypothetical protein n=1 Tax=Senegalia sp. (in: firmicutes) TaxID=1924098 RepID=UPI003F951CA9
MKEDNLKNNIEVWEDIVNIKDLIMSLIICTMTTFLAYISAPNEPPKPLFFGLTGAIIGFVICAVFIKPKRIFIETKEEN